jgi:DNA-binding MarR family transcriptional regulator
MSRSDELNQSAGAANDAAKEICPWSALEPSGEGLTVDNFLTTMFSTVGNALRRTITQPYAEQFGVSVSEWRLLSLVAHAGELAFADLVVQSTSDKALVSRTVRQLEQRGLLEIRAEGSTPRKKLTCVVTEAGAALHAQAIPIARQRQAEMICVLSPEEREGLYLALKKLGQHCLAPSPDGRDGGPSSYI